MESQSCHVFCYISRTNEHTPFCNPEIVQPIYNTHLNDTFCSPSQISETNNLIYNWICSGVYQETLENHCLRQGKWIAKFNPCLPILAISVQIENMSISALCDTGASKSLISSHLYNTVFSCSLLKDSRISHNIKLVDVNNKMLDIIALKNIQFTINTLSFQHDFVVFQSMKDQFLLGLDFFRMHNLTIYPSKGIAFEDNQVLNAQQLSLPKYEVYLKNDITLHKGAQQVATFLVRVPLNDIQSLSVINNFFLFSSEVIEPDYEYQELSIIHQYVCVNQYLQFEAVIANHTSDVRHYHTNQLVGYLEHVSVINNIDILMKDDLSVCLMIYLSQLQEEESLHIDENRIFNDPPSVHNFCTSDINCSSVNKEDIQFLKDLHIKYHQMFSGHDWSVGAKSGSSVDLTVRTNATICRQKTNKINPKIKQRADQIISTLLERNLIAVSKSPWNSRVLFVEKQPENVQVDNKEILAGQKEDSSKQRKLRLVVDYRFLNQRIKDINTSWPSPTVFEMLNTLHSAKFISTLDITQGFFHFRLSANARKYTAFSWNNVLYEFLRLPQGLRVSSAVM